MPITFYKITTPEPVAAYLARTINEHLQNGETVLWLVPGGSSIPIAIDVSKRIAAAPLQNLTVTLTDERYGQPGHADSNWAQLEQGGFSLPGATLQPVLTGQDLATTVAQFSETLDKDMANAGFVIGFFGIGPDGHTAGILPNTPAVADVNESAIGYDAGQFQRITATLETIASVDEAVIYAVGQAKWPIFDQLETQQLTTSVQPAQIFKEVPEVRIYNDYKGIPTTT